MKPWHYLIMLAGLVALFFIAYQIIAGTARAGASAPVSSAARTHRSGGGGWV